MNMSCLKSSSSDENDTFKQGELDNIRYNPIDIIIILVDINGILFTLGHDFLGHNRVGSNIISIII